MRFKKIAAVVSAAVVALALAGCGKEKTQLAGVGNNTQSRVESVAGGNTSTPSSTKQEDSKPEVVKIEMTDEIKNAALDSGLVQYNNDIFQRGGYITVADFVEKYKDRYDITYYCPNDGIKEAGSYEECKEYLLNYYPWIFEINKDHFGARWSYLHINTGYYLYLKDKNNSDLYPILAYAVNATSPDEKITLDKAIIVEVDSYRIDSNNVTPEWYPMGFNCKDCCEKYESESKNYTVKTLCEALEEKGLKKNEKFDKHEMEITYASDYKSINTYWELNNAGISCLVLGEENLFGAYPVYYYRFIVDPNTDKVTYVNCTIEYFVKP